MPLWEMSLLAHAHLQSQNSGGRSRWILCEDPQQDSGQPGLGKSQALRRVHKVLVLCWLGMAPNCLLKIVFLSIVTVLSLLWSENLLSVGGKRIMQGLTIGQGAENK